MEWISRLNKSMDYIEDNLAGEIDYDKMAEIACCSTFHFQRMFSYIAEVPLSEYIRRRRMSIAAVELQSSAIKVIELALKYGYESPTSFTRAFQGVHGLTPSAAREEGVQLKAYPRMSFSITIKGDSEMNYRIEKKGSFRIVGVKLHTEMDLEVCFAKVPQFWGETFQNGMFEVVCNLIDQPPYGVLGVSTCMNGKDFDYYIAAPTNKEAPENTYEYEVPEATWAIFEYRGAMPNAEGIQALQKRIVTEWLPTSGYEYANAPDIEMYSSGDTTSSDYLTEVWVPVVKK